MPLEFLMFWMRETLSNIRRNRLMSIAAVGTVTLALFILGAFFMALAFVRWEVGNQTRKLDLVVFLDPDITPQRRAQVMSGSRIPQIQTLQLVLKDQALKTFQTENPDIDMSDFQGTNNPFSDELHITLKNPEDIIKVRGYFEAIQGVSRTRNDDEPVRKLLYLNRVLSVAGLVALGGLGLAILMIIHNAIRLTIFARRREIRIMELVGATPDFIAMPFLLEGILYGLLGATIAAAVLGPVYLGLGRSGLPLAQELLPLAQNGALTRCLAGMMLAGIVFGLTGSWLSLARSLGKAAHI